MLSVQPKNIVSLLRDVSERTPAKMAFQFLKKGQIQGQMTYAELMEEATRIAAFFQSQKLQHQRVLLVLPQDLRFIAAFYGALLAGVIAVPSFPPFNTKQAERIFAIAKDADAAMVLTDSQGHLLLSKIIQTQMPIQAIEALPDGHAYQEYSPADNDLAFLQYTSGSTGHPKGVMVNHQNLVTNTFMIGEVFADSEQDIFGGWLPFFHDMGLVSMVVRPVCYGTTSVFMQPADFIRQPLEWLEMVSRYGITDCGGPNFGYDLCLRAAERLGLPAELELSRWRVAYNGAEQVRPETLRRFSRVFEASGFDAKAFLPCYGMAESTLFITGLPAHLSPQFQIIEREAFEQGKAIPSEVGMELASCGIGSHKQKLKIVDPVNLTELPEGEIGEVWVQGVHIAMGYWQQAEMSEAVFKARLADGQGPFLRTGDLGYLDPSGHLFITGRLKDLIIIRGKNFAPQDIEWLVENLDPVIRKYASAAFSIEAGHEEKLVLVSELAQPLSLPEREKLRQEMVRSVNLTFSIQPHDVVFIERNSLPKTTSGKVQRRKTKMSYLKGTLSLIS